MYRVLLYILFFCCSVIGAAQANVAENVDSVLPFKDRIAFRTNAVNWLLMTPNIGFEYDIVQNSFKKVSLNVVGRYNWNSNMRYASRYAYNIAGVKTEARWYFRTRKREDWERECLENLSGFYEKVQAKMFTLTSKESPRTYRAYYVAPYVSYDKYTLKLTDKGRQGSAISAGVSFGYNVPVYKYSDGSAIDFEFGASAGFVYTGYDEFAYEPDNSCYYHTGTKKGHIVPYPLVTDVNVAFVYRLKSIRDQINSVDNSKIEMMQKAYSLRKQYFDLTHIDDTIVDRIVVKRDEAGDTVRDEKGNLLYEKIYKKKLKFIDSDSLDSWNAVIARKNSEIEAYNKLLDKNGVTDSTAYLRKLRPAYKYLTISDKLLSFGYKKTIPNIDPDSTFAISDLNNKYLNQIIEQYKELGDDGVESVEQRMITQYKLLRGGLNDSDTLNPISFLEYLVTTIPQVNDYCIKSHNEKYIGASTTDNADFLRTSYSSPNLNGAPNRIFTLEQFVLDTIYVKEPIANEIGGENQSIEADNAVRKLKNSQLFIITDDSAAKADGEAESGKGKTKTKKKRKKAKATEDILPTDTLQVIDQQQTLPDTLRGGAEQQQTLPDTLRGGAEQQQTLPDTLQNTVAPFLASVSSVSKNAIKLHP